MTKMERKDARGAKKDEGRGTKVNNQDAEEDGRGKEEEDEEGKRR